jgi:multicomponent Na+:H+ antiporter subunit B
MNSIILTAAARIVTPLMIALSFFILLRGHNEPGGGFIGGLLGATAFALYAKATGVKATLAALRLPPPTIGVIGLGLALVAGLWGLVVEGDFLKGMWPFYGYGEDGTKEGVPVGSVLMFDIGVYLVVVGSVLTILFALEDDVAHPDHIDIEE